MASAVTLAQNYGVPAIARAISPVLLPLILSIRPLRDHSAVNCLIKILVLSIADTDSVKKPALELQSTGLAALLSTISPNNINLKWIRISVKFDLVHLAFRPGIPKKSGVLNYTDEDFRHLVQPG